MSTLGEGAEDLHTGRANYSAHQKLDKGAGRLSNRTQIVASLQKPTNRSGI